MSNEFGKYDASQVITEEDLEQLKQGFVFMLSKACCKTHQYQYVLSIGIMDTLKKWIGEGKPGYIRGEFNEDTGKFE